MLRRQRRRLVHRRRQDVSAQRKALHRESRRTALSAHSAPLLGAPHTDVPRAWHEHHMPLRVLEHTRAARGRVRLHRTERHSSLLPPGTAQRHVRHSASRTLRVRRVGDGRTAVVAAEEEGHKPAQSGSLLHGACLALHGKGGRTARPAHHTERRTNNHGAGGERIRLLRRG